MRYSNLTLGKIEALVNMVGGEFGIDRLIAGDRKIAIERHVINTTQEPFYNNEFFGIARHHALRGNKGLFEWKVENINLYTPNLIKTQSGLEQVERHSSMKVLNASVRDYLLKHRELLPNEWTDKTLCFSGTIFCDRKKRMYLPTLEYRKGWTDVYYDLAEKFTDKMVFLILKG